MANPILACTFLALYLAPVQATEAPPPSAIDLAFDRLYNFDFAGTHAALDAGLRTRPDDPLNYSVRGAAYLFSEYDRLKILELDFFEDDSKVTDRKKMKPDRRAKEQLFRVTAQARKLALAKLAVDSTDSHALFALCTAAGTETDYISLVEKRYFRAYSLSRESQQYAHRLLAMNPPFYDAYVTLGSVEYVVGSLNFFFRLFIRFDRITGSKQKAVENLKLVIERGKYFRPFAKVLLAAIYLREDQAHQALPLLKELERDFPENPLIRKEVVRAAEKVGRLQEEGRRNR